MVLPAKDYWPWREAATRPISATGRCPLDDKQGLVDDVFHSVARRYDLMNDLMSGGLHRAWKDALVTAVNPPQSDKPFALLDLAGGTGDVAFRVADSGRRRHPRHRLRHQRRDAGGRRASARRARARRRASHSSRAMPRRCRFPTAASTAVTIAFGIRNVPRIERALRRGLPRAQDRRAFPLPGIFLASTCRASTRSTSFIRSTSSRASASAVTGDREAYQYLVESIRKFPKPKAFARMMRGGRLPPRLVHADDRRRGGAAFRLEVVMARVPQIAASLAHVTNAAAASALKRGNDAGAP